MLFDAHTHRLSPEDAVFSLYNLLIGNADCPEGRHQAMSVGIHPWYVQPEVLDNQLSVVRALLDRPDVLAIGECGLDRLKGPDMAMQEKAFLAQIALAEAYRKPVIIHCVRAFGELLALRKALRPTTPWVVHGFVNKPETARQLLQSGCYLSLGAALLCPDSNAVRVLPDVPPGHLLLETDEADVSIAEVYKAAGRLLNVSEHHLIQQIGRTFAEVFQQP